METTSTCSGCASPDLLAVRMRMDDGDVVFRVCLWCDSKVWEKNGLPASRELALTAIPRR